MKKKMKSSRVLLLAASLACAPVFAQADSDFTILEHPFLTGFGLLIVGYSGSSDVVTIPAKIGNTPVRGIADFAFADNSSITAVTIPGSVREIGDAAFQNCTSLQSVTLSNGIQEIEDGAFAGCTALSSIVIPNSVREIGDFAFSGCASLASITLPKRIEIEEGAFMGCSALNSASQASIRQSGYRGGF
jgi:hypothetical protein